MREFSKEIDMRVTSSRCLTKYLQYTQVAHLALKCLLEYFQLASLFFVRKCFSTQRLIKLFFFVSERGKVLLKLLFANVRD